MNRIAGILSWLVVGSVILGAWAWTRAPLPRGVRLFREPLTVAPFIALDLNGRPVSSADLRGQVVLVNFWATWCGPCRAEIGDLVELQAKYAAGLRVLGVSRDSSPDPVRAFIVSQRIPYSVVMSTPELDLRFPGVLSLPTTFLLDREGRVAIRHVGRIDPFEIEQEARVLMELPVDVAVHRIDSEDSRFDRAVQSNRVPGLDLASVPLAQLRSAVETMKSRACPCGCGMTVARCRIDDSSCKDSLTLAKEVIKAAR